MLLFDIFDSAQIKVLQINHLDFIFFCASYL